MPWIQGGLALAGGLFGGSSARRAAEARAASERESARLAAEESRFRPVGLTTRFGTSDFQFDPKTGRVSGASYSLDPALRGMQNRFLGLAETGLTQAEQAQGQYAPLGQAGQRLFDLGNQYLAQSPQEAAQQYMTQQQDLYAPSRERQLSGIRTNLFNTGRTGLAVGGTGLRPGGGEGLRAANPELEAYYNSIANQDAQLAAQATEAGQRQTAFASGLFGTGGNLANQMYGLQSSALGPYQAYLSGATSLEGLGQQPLTIGSDLGRNIANTSGANALYGGGMGAAQSNYAANAYNPFATALTGFSQNPALIRGARNAFGFGNTNALDTSAYGSGLGGFEAAQYDIYGR